MESQTSMSVNQQLPNDRIKKRIDNGKRFFTMFETISAGDYKKNRSLVKKQIRIIANYKSKIDPDRDPLYNFSSLEGALNEYKDSISQIIDEQIAIINEQIAIINEVKEEKDNEVKEEKDTMKSVDGGKLHKKSRKGKRRNRKSRKR